MPLFHKSVLNNFLIQQDKDAVAKAKKKDAQELKAEIEKPDKAIDQLVYELSEEKKKIVEEA